MRKDHITVPVPDDINEDNPWAEPAQDEGFDSWDLGPLNKASNWDQAVSEVNTVKRTFETGAMRDTDDGKLDYEGFNHPAVERRYAEYMHRNRQMADGSLRDSDNWQQGIPKDVYMKSGLRHVQDWWALHREDYSPDVLDIEEVLCAVIFNAKGYLFEILQERRDG